MPTSLYGFDEPETPLASPCDSHVLATRAQPGMGFAVSCWLAFSVALRADFAA